MSTKVTNTLGSSSTSGALRFTGVFLAGATKGAATPLSFPGRLSLRSSPQGVTRFFAARSPVGGSLLILGEDLVAIAGGEVGFAGDFRAELSFGTSK